MTLNQVLAILPLIIPAIAMIMLMLLIATVRNHALAVTTTLVSLLVALVMVFVSYDSQPQQITQLLTMDGYAYFYIALTYAATMIVCALSYGYLSRKNTVREEYYLFLLSTALGCAVLVSSNHFASLFIGIELLSLSLYVLIAYVGTRHNTEAGLKYFVITAVSIAFLLFGTALIYAASGSLKFEDVSYAMVQEGLHRQLLYLAGLAMVLVGISFKLALVPFHLWIADVFEGASAPVAGFLGTASKGAVFAVLMRYVSGMNILGHHSIFILFACVATASMFVGNITALLQSNIKRMLGYSSIAHFGYLLVTLMAADSLGVDAAMFYLTAYFITVLIAFGVIGFLSKGDTDCDTIQDYQGLALRHPVYALLLTVAMLSLAGIPLTVGFIGKFYIITAGAGIKLWGLLIILVINSVIGLFYYLRVVISLYLVPTKRPGSQGKEQALCPSFSRVGFVSLLFLLFLLVYLGIYPGPLMSLIEQVTHR